MKKNLSIFMSLAVLMGISLPALALAQSSVDGRVKASVEVRRDGGRDTTHKPTMEERRATLDARINDVKERMHDKSGEVRERVASSSVERKERFDTKMKERISMYTDKIYGALTKTLERLTSFEGKVEVRLSELANAGIDVTLSEEELATAARVRVTAEANIADLEAKMKTGLAGETSREEVMVLVRAAREELAMVRKAYAEVLVQVRADVKASKTTR